MIGTKHAIKRCMASIRSVSATTTVSDFNEIPTPRGLPIIGTTLSLLSHGSAAKLHLYVDSRHEQLGPIFKDKIGPVSAVFLSNPEDIRAVFAHEGKYPVHIIPEAWMVYNDLHECSRGLLFMDGEEWLQNRRIMNKFLLKGDFTWMEDACKEITKDLIERWTSISCKNKVFPDLERHLYRWSLDVVISILMGVQNYQQLKHKLTPLLQELASNIHVIFDATSKLSLLPASLAAKLGILRWKKFENSVTHALSNANNLVSQLLELLPKGNGLLAKMQREGMNEEIIKRIVTDLILAAGDTTTYSMEWTLYLIAKNHDEIQNRLYQELLLEPSPPLLKNIIRESLRLYPVAPFLTRFLPEDTVIGGYNIPKNTLIILSVYTSSRDAKYFDNPNKFKPDRWLRSGSNNITQMQQATLPFAFGARSCIGKKIAEIQLQTALAEIVNKFDIQLQNTEEIEIVLKMIAVPSKPIKLKLTQR